MHKPIRRVRYVSPFGVRVASYGLMFFIGAMFVLIARVVEELLR